jgi:hypothetical protein
MKYYTDILYHTGKPVGSVVSDGDNRTVLFHRDPYGCKARGYVMKYPMMSIRLIILRNLRDECRVISCFFCN